MAAHPPAYTSDWEHEFMGYAALADTIIRGDEAYSERPEDERRNLILGKHLVFKDPTYLELLHDDLRGDGTLDGVVETAFSRDPSSIRFARHDLLQDPEFAFRICTRNGLALEFFHTTIRDNSKVVKVAVNQNGHALLFAGRECRRDEAEPSPSQIAIAQNPLAIQHVHPIIQTDDKTMKQFWDSSAGTQEEREVWSKEIKQLYDTIHKGLKLYHTIHKGLKLNRYLDITDPEMGKLLVDADPMNLELLDVTLRSDISPGGIVRRAFKKDTSSLRFAAPSVLINHRFAIYVCALDGMALKYFHISVRGKKSVAMVAVYQNGMALYHVGSEARQDSAVFECAMNRNPVAYRFLDPIRQTDINFLRQAFATPTPRSLEELKGGMIKLQNTLTDYDKSLTNPHVRGEYRHSLIQQRIKVVGDLELYQNVVHRLEANIPYLQTMTRRVLRGIIEVNIGLLHLFNDTFTEREQMFAAAEVAPRALFQDLKRFDNKTVWNDIELLIHVVSNDKPNTLQRLNMLRRAPQNVLRNEDFLIKLATETANMLLVFPWTGAFKGVVLAAIKSKRPFSQTYTLTSHDLKTDADVLQALLFVDPQFVFPEDSPDGVKQFAELYRPIVTAHIAERARLADARERALTPPPEFFNWIPGRHTMEELGLHR